MPYVSNNSGLKSHIRHKVDLVKGFVMDCKPPICDLHYDAIKAKQIKTLFFPLILFYNNQLCVSFDVIDKGSCMAGNSHWYGCSECKVPIQPKIIFFFLVCYMV